MMTANKPVYRMSSAGKCPRALSAERLGYEPAPPKPWLERAAEEGNWHEQRIKSELRTRGLAVIDEQREVTLDYPTFTLVGHIDGIVVGNGSEQRLLEIKSMSQFEFDRWMRGGFDAFPEYEAQLICYMVASGMEHALYIVKNRNTGYVDRREIDSNNIDLSRIELYARQLSIIEEYAARGELRPFGLFANEKGFDPQSIQCQRCNYQHLCVTRPEASEIDTAMLDEAVKLWRKGKALVDEGQALVDEAKLTLGKCARGLITRQFIHNDLAVQLIVQHRVSYDRRVLEQTVPEELLKPARKEQEVEQLRIHDLKEVNNA